MDWRHPEHPGRRLRLAYCLNLHPAENLEELVAGVREITLPLRDRLVGEDERFGVGMYFAAGVARELASLAGEPAAVELSEFLERERLDPFTFNAFPYGGFHAAGLKERVFEPRWGDPARLAFTLDVARLATRLSRGSERAHVSISSHPGRHGAFEPGEWERARDGYVAAADALAELEAAQGLRVVLAIEAEPRASAGDTRAAAELLARLRAEAPPESQAALRRHVGTCLDCCHSAVELEEPRAAFELATADGTPLGKLQFSSALRVAAPGEAPARSAALLALDEPRYLHQVTGRAGAAELRLGDLPELARALETDPAAWLACEEWRCHFHVPVDLDAVGGELGTTRDHADRLLEHALDDPARWGSDELHLEIETYTWDILPGAARGSGALVDGLEREYRHVMARLAARGWQRESSSSGR